MSREANQYIRVHTGIKFFPLDPWISEITIEDIAHAGSNNCRWGGHCDEFLSVDQHCCMVHDLVPARLRRVALLHDASESYILDMPRPIKYQMPAYLRTEENLMECIAARFGFHLGQLEEIKGADDFVLYYERQRNFSCGGAIEVLSDRAVDFYFDNCVFDWSTRPLIPWTQKRSRQEFLQRFYDL